MAVVLAHTFDKPEAQCRGWEGITAMPGRSMLGTWRNFARAMQGTHVLLKAAHLWLRGRWGGPVRHKAEAYARLRDFPALPRLR